MIDAKILDSFNGLIAVETANLDDRIADEIGRAAMEASAAGRSRSGAAMRQVAMVAVHSIPVRAQLAFETLLKAMQAHGSGVSANNRDEVIAVLGTFLSDQHNRLVPLIANSSTFKGNNIASAPFIKPITDVVLRETNRLKENITLMAATASQQPAAAPGATPTMHFHGNVGVIQTGDHAVGISHQTIDASAREGLEQALDLLAAALAKETALPAQFKSEVEETVRDTRTELAKPTPNTTKIKGYVTAVADVVRFVPALKPCYDTLKWSATFVGVTLPG